MTEGANIAVGPNDTPIVAAATNSLWDGKLAVLFLLPPAFFPLLLLAGLPVMGAAWLMLSPDIVLAHHNALDLLFNFAGAWHIQSGHTQHIDFHEPVGQLNFLLTALAFQIAGFVPKAFIVGQMFMLALLFVAAMSAAMRRLPLAAAVTFVLFICLPAVMPVNVGSPLDNYTFGMSYNRYSWSAISIVCLILFAPPLYSQRYVWVDWVCYVTLTLVMFYLKITYFIVSVAALLFALLISTPIRKRWRPWCCAVLVVFANAAAPHSYPYEQDLLWAIETGTGDFRFARFFLHGILGNGTEFAVYCAGFLAAVFQWRRQHASYGLPFAIVFLIGASVFLFSLNTQDRGLPLGTVILFLLYSSLSAHRTAATSTQLFALLLVPAMTFLAALGSLMGYHVLAKPSEKLFIASQTNIRGLAVPITTKDTAFNRPQYLYVVSLMEAAALFAEGRHPIGRIQVIDRTNPLPFMLGIDPPRGGDLFWEPAARLRPAVEVLGDSDYVLVPKVSTAANLTRAAMDRYNDYLVKYFPRREETTYWTLFSRAEPPRLR